MSRIGRQVKPKPVIEDLDTIIRQEGKKPIKIESWRYYSIMDAPAGRQEAD